MTRCWRAAVLALAGLLSAAGPCPGQDEYSGARPSLLRVGGLLVFYDSAGPLSFRTLTFKDLPAGARLLGEVRGRGCQHGLSIPISSSLRGTSVSGAYGRGGFAKALEGIRKANPEADGIVDVKIDTRTLSILGVYRRLCTEVTARGFTLR